MISMMLFQVIFYIINFILLYWVLTFNYTMLGICALVSLAQITIKPGRNKAYKNFIFKYFQPQKYFCIDRTYEETIPDDEKTLFGFHPHSVYCYGLMGNMNERNFVEDKLAKVTPLGSRFVLLLPIIGLHFRLWGFEPVSPRNLRKLMGKGKSVALVPGGYEEATLTTPK
jgi:2-acylglycerol O-acyltransferase 2